MCIDRYEDKLSIWIPTVCAVSRPTIYPKYQFFHNIAKKEQDGCTKFLTLVGKWSAVDLCC